MATAIEVENTIKVIAMLSEIDGIQFKRHKTKEDVFIVTEPDYGLVLIIDVEEKAIVFIMEIDAVEEITQELGQFLLTINAKEAIHGAFGYDPDLKTIIFKNTLEIENLDLNELQRCIESMFITVYENIRDINKIIGG